MNNGYASGVKNLIANVKKIRAKGEWIKHSIKEFSIKFG